MTSCTLLVLNKFHFIFTSNKKKVFFRTHFFLYCGQFSLRSIFRCGQLTCGQFSSAINFRLINFLWSVFRTLPFISGAFAQCFVLLSPKVYTGGKARNFFKSQSPPHVPSYFHHIASYFLHISPYFFMFPSYLFSQSLYRG